MKIRLLEDLPVAAQHGAVKGRVFDAQETPEDERGRGAVYYWIMGDAGERVGVLYHEAKVIKGAEDRRAKS